MDSIKQGSSETTSEESDHLEQVRDDTGSRRSYECTFCKRGFTNAQALGGHMNIHRKDRAKAKQLTSSSSHSNKSNEDCIPSRYISPVSHEPSEYFTVLEAQTQRNYHMYFQPSSASNPRHPHANFHQSGFIASRSQSLSMNQDLFGVNLSLRIGPVHVEDDGMKRAVSEADELDLELRLGHDPYWICFISQLACYIRIQCTSYIVQANGFHEFSYILLCPTFICKEFSILIEESRKERLILFKAAHKKKEGTGRLNFRGNYSVTYILVSFFFFLLEKWFSLNLASLWVQKMNLNLQRS